MDNLHTVHVTFTCSHCGAANELTAAWVHEATIIHCSACATAVAPLSQLRDRPARTHVNIRVSEMANA